MKGPHLPISFLILSLAISHTKANSKLIIVENAKYLDSSLPEINYPENNGTLDVIWLFSHSITLNINNFHLNGHDGDFILISEQPLLNAQELIEMNGTDDGDYLGFLAESIVTDQGILLSWKAEKQVEALNPAGTFVLFHTEAKEVPGAPTQFTGFKIEVINYDDSLTTTTSTTPDPLIPEQPGQDIYISKFLDCMQPLEFFKKTDDFKLKISTIATEYCNETGIHLDEPITYDDVNIPGPNEGKRAGVHYCSTAWYNYESCVEVTFAIIRMNTTGYYILTADLLEDMWDKKSDGLRIFGYCPYDPPREAEDLSTLGWIVFLLGVILGLMILLCFAWLKNARSLLDYKLSFTTDFLRNREKLNEGPDDDKPQRKHFDSSNPIFSYFTKTPQNDYSIPREELYPSGNYLDPTSNTGNIDGNPDDAPLGFKRHSFTNNPTFEEVPADVYAYDNDAFKGDNDATAARASSSSGRGNSMEGSDTTVGSDKPLVISRIYSGSIGDTDI